MNGLTLNVLLDVSVLVGTCFMEDCVVLFGKCPTDVSVLVGYIEGTAMTVKLT